MASPHKYVLGNRDGASRKPVLKSLSIKVGKILNENKRSNVVELVRTIRRMMKLSSVSLLSSRKNKSPVVSGKA